MLFSLISPDSLLHGILKLEIMDLGMRPVPSNSCSMITYFNFVTPPLQSLAAIPLIVMIFSLAVSLNVETCTVTVAMIESLSKPNSNN